MTGQILALREHLIEQQVTLVVVMEATGDYWKPFYYLLEDGPFELVLVNARQIKNVPGRKTSPTRPGWRNSARTAWSVARACRRSRLPVRSRVIAVRVRVR